MKSSRVRNHPNFFWDLLGTYIFKVGNLGHLRAEVVVLVLDLEVPVHHMSDGMKMYIGSGQ